MKPQPNPICKRGKRNIYCPLYSHCLDHAINHVWEHWSCSQCSYREIKAFDEAGYGAEGHFLDYELPPRIIKNVKRNESD
jgi:hypothetical protein